MLDNNGASVISAFLLWLLGFKPIDWPRLGLSHTYGVRKTVPLTYREMLGWQGVREWEPQAPGL